MYSGLEFLISYHSGTVKTYLVLWARALAVVFVLQYPAFDLSKPDLSVSSQTYWQVLFSYMLLLLFRCPQKKVINVN